MQRTLATLVVLSFVAIIAALVATEGHAHPVVRHAGVPHYGLHMEKMSADCRRDIISMTHGHQQLMLDIASYQRLIRKIEQCGGKLEPEAD